MRTSNKILLIIIISVAVFTVVLITGTWLYISSYNSGSLKSSEESSEIIRKNFDINDFNSVRISGFFKLEITQSESYNISLSAPEYIIDHINIHKSANKLFIKQSYIIPIKIRVKISMPSLSEIKTSGNTKISFSDFKTGSLNIRLKGSNKILGINSIIKDMNINGSGLARIDLDSCSVVNAELYLSGSGATDLNMAGGMLTGTVNGAHKINYRGKVIEQNIITSGSVIIDKTDSF